MTISQDFINKYNTPGPRYTSYPPATAFTAEFSNADLKKAFIASNNENPKNISIYIHIPFCPHQCSFCGCTTIIAQGKTMIERYVDALILEINNGADLIDTENRLLTQVHWGGGTPNSIPYKHIERIMQTVHKRFKFHPKAEVAIECSPAYLTLNQVDELARFGFNRVSIGIQDFNTDVLDLVNRKHPKVPVRQMVAKFKSLGFSGINLDLIYGLPLQTTKSFLDSVQKAIDCKPDRIVTFSYAHVPWVKAYQSRLEKVGLPTPEEKMDMFIQSLNLLNKNGYLSIGMDHYAKKDDLISIALGEKKLHRNFQGYCTIETTGQVYGFGASSISQTESAYIQNVKNTAEYIKQINENNFAVERGYQLSETEKIRKQVINEIMCNNYLDFSRIAEQFGKSVAEIKRIVEYAPNKFKEFIDDDLLSLTENTISVHPKGMLVVRNIAMKLDPALKLGEQKFSKTV